MSVFACIVEARMRASRLPGKVLKPILGQPMLALMIERLRRARTIDRLVVATTDQSVDEPILRLADSLGVACFRGSEEDVLDRVLKAARSVEADVIVETTGDCPLHDPAIIDKVVADYRLGGADFVANMLEYTTPRGTDVRVFSTAALAHIAATSNDPADREHVSLHFWEHPDRYRLRNVACEMGADAPGFRLTVDTAEDLELVRRVYEALYPANPRFTIADVLDFLRRNPEVAAINQNIAQKNVR